MTIAKRFFYVTVAFALCAAMSLGSLSFMPKAFAIDDYKFDFSQSDIPVLTGNYQFGYVSSSSGNYFIFLYESLGSSTFEVRATSSGGVLVSIPYGASCLRHRYSSSSGTWSTSTVTNTNFTSDYIGYPFPLISENISLNFLPLKSFSFSFTEPVSFSSPPQFWDYSPFFFPQLPHGEFDGNINVVDGTYNIDFPSNASIDGSMTVVPGGGDQYTWTWSNGNLYWYGETVQGEHEGWISPNYQLQTPPSGTVTGTIVANRDISLSLENFDSVVNYTPAYNENSRFRCWSCVMDSSYVWFVSDTRNKITGSIVSVTSDEVTWKYEFADPQGGNTIYPTWAIVFSPMGEVIQVLSPTTVSNKNTYTLSCSIGTLEQDQDTGIWSCDPLYHGFWFSNDSPPVANITHLNVAENKKYLANPVFGESAFQLNFLDSINRGIADINTNIQSLQSSMHSSISNQTSAFQNMDAPSAEQPDTTDMMDYFSETSAFNAPDAGVHFGGVLGEANYYAGTRWWTSKFNDIFMSSHQSASVLVAFITAMLTLGLGAFIIGRRVYKY